MSNSMYQTRQTNNGDSVNVTTNLWSGYSSTSKLIVSAWNNQISIKFAPFKGNDANGIRQYATEYTEIVSTALTAENAGAFIEGIKTVIMPAIKDQVTKSISVSMGSELNHKVLTVAFDAAKDEVSLTLTYGGMNGTQQSTIAFTFATKSYFVDYNPNASSSTNEVPTQAAFYNFVEVVKKIYDLVPVVPHVTKYNDLTKAAASNRYANSQQQNSMGSSYAGGYQAPTASANSASEFLQFV